MLKGKSFQFSLEKTAFAVIAALTCYAMSYWQYQRYVFKRDLFVRIESQQALGVRDFDPHSDNWEDWLYGLVRVSGHFSPEHEILLINRSMNDRPGMKLITPLLIAGSERVLMVDRGFIPYEMADDDQRQVYEVDREVTVIGMLRPNQTPQFAIATPAVSAADPTRKRWHRIDLDVIAEDVPFPLFPVFLEATDGVDDGPTPFKQVELPASRHMNYTIQWISFGTFAFFLGMFFQFKRPRRQHSAR